MFGFKIPPSILKLKGSWYFEECIKCDKKISHDYYLREIKCFNDVGVESESYCKLRLEDGITMGFHDSLKQDEIAEMDKTIDEFIKQPMFITDVSKDIRETVLNGRNVVLKFVIEEIIEDGDDSELEFGDIEYNDP